MRKPVQFPIRRRRTGAGTTSRPASAGRRRQSRNSAAAEITPRLLNLNQAAEYLGISYWSVRDLVQSGMLASVKLPAPRARDGRSIRRTLIDRQDLDQLIELWKEQNAA
jgi:excisionase family DNA binding protein